MTILVTLPDYDEAKGFESKWENGFNIKVENQNDSINITANKAGLISLAYQLLNLAQDSFPPGYHLHYDSLSSLDEGSKELVLSKSL